MLRERKLSTSALTMAQGRGTWPLKTTAEGLETSVRLLPEEARAVELEQVRMDIKRLLGPHAD